MLKRQLAKWGGGWNLTWLPIMYFLIQIGKWTYNLTSNESQSNVIISVQSKARNPGNDVIQITSWLGDNNIITFDPAQKLGVFAEVIRGRAPVLNAKVTAIVERPQSLPSNIRLYDNGVGEY